MAAIYEPVAPFAERRIMAPFSTPAMGSILELEEKIVLASETVCCSFLTVACQWFLAFLHQQKLQTTYTHR